jgi:glycosyltransferase involved in cell wall biosynthesis
MSKIRFYTVFLTQDPIIVSKDPGMIPYILARDFGYESYFASFINMDLHKDLVEKYEGLNFIQLNNARVKSEKVIRDLLNFRVLSFILKNARKMDVLNLYFLKFSIFYGILYKILNPKGILYLKLDFDVNSNKAIDSQGFVMLRSFVFGNFLKYVANIVSVESTDAFSYIHEKYRTDYSKLLYIPNGIDNIEVCALGIRTKTFEEKENLILSVQRVGTFQKNTELILNSLKECNLCDWKIVIIGTIEDCFLEKIESYFEKYPHLRDKVTFTGAICDKRTLYEWYNKAKIFCLTSRWESFGIVYVEAQFFGNYIISTPVVSTPDIVGNKDLGCVIQNEVELCEAFNLLVSDETILKRSFSTIVEHATNFYWQNILKKLDVEIKRK